MKDYPPTTSKYNEQNHTERIISPLVLIITGELIMQQMPKQKSFRGWDTIRLDIVLKIGNCFEGDFKKIKASFKESSPESVCFQIKKSS